MAEEPTETANGTVSRRQRAAWVRALMKAGDSLWVASLAVLFVVWGYDWIPRVIRMMGRAGQAETIEWAVYMSMLAGFPLATMFIALVVPRMFGQRAQTVVKLSAVLVAFWIALLFLIDGRIHLLMLALLPASLATVEEMSRQGPFHRLPASRLPEVVSLLAVGTIAWLCAGSLVYWDRGSSWFLGNSNFAPMAAALVAFLLLSIVMPRVAPAEQPVAGSGELRQVVARVVAGVSIGILILFSFRTNPVVEFYHWGFWTGPIEQLRQGGWLLWDTPSQYGFLSILIPTALPGNAWQSFWFYQSLIYAIVAVTIFVVVRRMWPGIAGTLGAGLLVFTTLFYRPRSASLILPAQMTPSGGPVRFVWCFVMLVYLLWGFEAHRGEKAKPGHLGFPLTGHIIWLFSLAWSFESAIYTSAIWFAAFAVYLIQKASIETRRGMSRTSIIKRLVLSSLVPFIMAAILYAIVWMIYRVSIGVGPDMAGYIEYGLLYSRGFGALPIDTTGAVWYLLLVFFVVSTITVALLVSDWRDFRVVVSAGVWGGVWSISSYFVSRSHPVNLLSIIPVLLFALAILVIVVKDLRGGAWNSYTRIAVIPLFAIPIALTLGHPSLMQNIRTPQLAVARFTDQLPLMDDTLESLMRESGAKPTDPVVRIVDGRLVMPAWRGTEGTRIMSERSWLPKPYEIIGTLSPDRRQVYIDRDAAKPISGWLIQNQTDTVKWFGDHLHQIEQHHRPARKFSKGPWSLWWMERTQ